VRAVLNGETVELSALMNLRDRIVSSECEVSEDTCQALAGRILKVAEPLLAYDLLRFGLDKWPENTRLSQLFALTLARTGAADSANSVVTSLYQSGHSDAETLGILARTHKDLWERSTDLSAKQKHLDKACEIYRRAFMDALKSARTNDAIYTGINAATTLMLRDKTDEAKDVAGQVRELCVKKLEKENDYWAMAAIAEAAVVAGNLGEAVVLYQRASAFGKGNYGDLSSTRRNARLLLKHIGEDVHSFDSCFSLPVVLVFSGHMIDSPDRLSPRFPRSMESTVSEEIRKKLSEHENKIGYSSAACGSDILFLEEMLKQKGEINIVLPFNKKDFVRTSVAIEPDSGWLERFETVLKKATRVIVAGEEGCIVGERAFEYANTMQIGLSSLHAQILDSKVVPLLVWDMGHGDGPSGTSAVMNHLREHDFEPEIIDISGLVQPNGGKTDSAADMPKTGAAMDQSPEGFSEDIVAMLFADAKGYSKLNEREIPLFVRHVLGALGQVVDELPVQPVMKNSWGDSLFLVFESVEDAGRAALTMNSRLNAMDFSKMGLPSGINLRVALHAGPVYACDDPITGKKNYFGTHVNRTARIEPITPPGNVYASQAFAALAAARGVKTFKCNYIGETPLAKGFGVFPTYHVTRS